ncbi:MULTISPECIES: iron donor protein CyaY [unclassified Gilliamella]|uniref:iron donor protein CyaY n=1 Tax=unclassified Gilliamella TaxID=2685620 RepID=UPI00080ED469|nr:iron donor protein CyaY [Gilliamella apicola]OCG61338.1 iron donor protein CyaY [Gilliamella apicola]OCG62281.1 iron donor protein CyaY [Gilliamella apicola]OCG67187.1 iron donor protein CyaY [Gilliamella apicola]OCG75171.1 iron donor protein CyaY [Gilliamella apicola]
MNTAQFHALTDELFNKLELYLDDYADKHDIDLDYEANGNVITVSFPNGSKIIVNTQEPLFQVWLATRIQGYHFEYINDNWICNRTNQPFDQIFSESVREQADQ